MNFNYYKFFGLTILLISILLLAKVAIAGEKSQWLNENPCMIKIITTSIEEEINGQKVTTVTKKEVMECKDGYDGPNYWELFAQFYYANLTTPAYCRQYARPDHPFKTPGMVCLSENGVWEVQ